ncbi:MAG: ImmA/IrrE family metallo-endopeptidase [Chitinophagales bacterium]|nr:ImmA/IrrE family metallo-endopeptidase [Chitinophagales bacterium]
MIELTSKDDIERISFDLLKSSKSLDVFPTPVDKIISYSNLLVKSDIDIATIHQGYISRASDALKRALSKVRGLLDRQEKTIYLDLSQGFNRQNFVKLHECGHDVLPWQRGFHDILDDDDHSLDIEYHEEFEVEANYFATVTLFQHDRFIDELQKLNLSIASAMQLGKYFGASIQASLRRFVECSKNRCSLIVLENISPTGTKPECGLRNAFFSDTFLSTFGIIELPVRLGYTWPFVRDYYHNRRFVKDGKITLKTRNGDVEFNYEFFNNTYKGLVFIYPVGERKSSKTKIILTQKGNTL